MDHKTENTKANTGKAYLYLVKTPSSNDLTVCAADNILYPGTFVVAPTRYGMDMGIIVGTAPVENEQSAYEPGCPRVRGACHFGPTNPPEENLAAWGEPPVMGPVPQFSFQSTTEIENDETEFDESKCWNARYRDPVLVDVDGDVLWISHIATPAEMQKFQDNNEAERKAVTVCNEKIAKHNLDMKLVAAHFLLCEPKTLFFFTADERVDFRELVKDLVSVFKMRIELRQIGVRDEARVLGGLAVCGRDFCCHCVSDKLDPVTIKMAKEQNLSLNSMKISGPCGRLLCCLSYEYDFYCEEKQAYPPEGSKLKLGEELMRVTEVNILSKNITLLSAEGGTVTVPRESLYFSSRNSRWEIARKFQDEFLGN